jgi:hypothetical protein
MEEFLSKLIMRKPPSLFIGEGLTGGAVDESIDFSELSNNIGYRETDGVLITLKLQGFPARVTVK